MDDWTIHHCDARGRGMWFKNLLSSQVYVLEVTGNSRQLLSIYFIHIPIRAKDKIWRKLKWLLLVYHCKLLTFYLKNIAMMILIIGTTKMTLNPLYSIVLFLSSATSVQINNWTTHFYVWNSIHSKNYSPFSFDPALWKRPSKWPTLNSAFN